MTPGIHQCSMQEYLNLRALSSGLVVTLDRFSPAHARWQQDHPEDNEASSRSDLGTAVHDALLEGTDRIVSVDAADWRTKAAKEARDFARLEGKIPLLAHKVAQVQAAVTMATGFIELSELGGLFSAGEAERTLVWSEESFERVKDTPDILNPAIKYKTEQLCGILLKARPDWLSHTMKVCCHVKTSEGSVAPGPFSRTVDNMSYDTMIAFYERACEAVGLAGYRHVILAIEQDGPHGCALYDLSPAKATIAHARVQRAIDTWQECVASGHFPAYDRRVHSLEPKPWDLAAEEAIQHQAFTAGEMASGIPL